MSEASSANRVVSRFRRLIASVFDIPDAKGITTRDGAAANMICAAPEIRVSAHGDGLIILHIPSGRIFSCNSTGGRIWKGLTNGSSEEAVSDEISREFGLTPATAREHTGHFVARLVQEGLLIRA